MTVEEFLEKVDAGWGVVVILAATGAGHILIWLLIWGRALVMWATEPETTAFDDTVSWSAPAPDPWGGVSIMPSTDIICDSSGKCWNQAPTIPDCVELGPGAYDCPPLGDIGGPDPDEVIIGGYSFSPDKCTRPIDENVICTETTT